MGSQVCTSLRFLLGFTCIPYRLYFPITPNPTNNFFCFSSSMNSAAFCPVARARILFNSHTQLGHQDLSILPPELFSYLQLFYISIIKTCLVYPGSLQWPGGLLAFDIPFPLPIHFQHGTCLSWRQNGIVGETLGCKIGK